MAGGHRGVGRRYSLRPVGRRQGGSAAARPGSPVEQYGKCVNNVSRVNALDRPRPKKRSFHGHCHWHWVKAKSCDAVQAHKSCTTHTFVDAPVHVRNAHTRRDQQPLLSRVCVRFCSFAHRVRRPDLAECRGILSTCHDFCLLGRLLSWCPS